MRFFENHCNLETFRHAPHKWFGACLVSPIHAAELHYKKKYHLNFRHAKKLFVFDMLLLLTTIAIGSTTLFWYFYDPTLTSQVYLDINTAPTRVRSGEIIQITAAYKNNSAEQLLDAKLRMRLPEGFIVTYATSSHAAYDATAKQFVLPPLAPSAEGQIMVKAQAIALPEHEETIRAELSYVPKKTGNIEVKTVHYGITARGSVLEGQIDSAAEVFGTERAPISIRLKNTGSESIDQVHIPLSTPENVKLESLKPVSGKIQDGSWIIEKILPNEEVKLEAIAHFALGPSVRTIALQFTPIISVNGVSFSQNLFAREVKVLHPSFSISSSWSKTGVQPGGQADLVITLYNNGDTDLSNLSVSISLVKGMVNPNTLGSLNGGIIKNGILTIDQRHRSALNTLPVGQSREISIKIPIVAAPGGGTDIQASIPITARAFPKSRTADAIAKESVSQKIKIGTRISGSLETRYYTNEGDQLGRGPLPPTQGKETKYWIFITVANATSKVDELTLTARLPAHIAWTGKTSVSQGQDVSFNAGSRTVFWKTQSLAAHATAGVYMEVAFTPLASDIGKIPTVLENIQISGFDRFIEQKVEQNLGSIKADLKNDKKALEQGIFVQ